MKGGAGKSLTFPLLRTFILDRFPLYLKKGKGGQQLPDFYRKWPEFGCEITSVTKI